MAGTWFVMAFAGLAAFAAIASLELDIDSYSHFVAGVEVIAKRNVDSLIFDLWMKPLPTLIYGIPGQGGIWLARRVVYQKR